MQKLTDKQIDMLNIISNKGYEVGMYAMQQHYLTLNQETLTDDTYLANPGNWDDEECTYQINNTVKYALVEPNGNYVSEDMTQDELFAKIKDVLERG